MLLADLRALDIHPGDTLMVHASIKSTGARGDVLLDALAEATGPFGTVLVAAYHYDFAKGVPFSRETPSGTGVLADIARMRPHAMRTRHPMFSFAVVGYAAQAFADLPGVDAFGEESPFALLRAMGGKILLVGVDYQHGFTFVHHVEQMEGTPHRIRKEFGGMVEGQRAAVTACVRAPRTVTRVEPMGQELDASEAVRLGVIGHAEARVISAAHAYPIIAAGLRRTDGGQGYTHLRLSPRSLAETLWPMPRSLTGPGTRATLAAVASLMPELQRIDVPSGMRCFDWTVPQEWELRRARLEDMAGHAIVAYPEDGALSVVGYSQPVDRVVSRAELDAHLHSHPDRPMARPYVTSYYRPDWGFCVPQIVRDRLGDGPFRALIDARVSHGHMPLGVIDLPATERDPSPLILFSTNTCHPSMAVNEISGVVALTFLAEYVRDLRVRRFSYRFLFVPETIGTLAYLALGDSSFRQRLVAGFTVACVPCAPTHRSRTRSGQTFADHLVADLAETARHSDDRQYAHVNVDLPVVGLYGLVPGAYPEYHTSDDTLSLLTDLDGAQVWLRQLVDRIEASRRFRVRSVGEPFLGEHYPTDPKDALRLLALLDRCDGQHDLSPADRERIGALVEAGIVEEV